MRWIIAAIIVFLLAWTLKAGLIVYAGAALAIVAVAGRFLAGSGLRAVSASREVSDMEVTAGDNVNVNLRIENESPRSIVWLLLEDLLPESVLSQRPPRVQVKGKRLRVRSLSGHQTAKVDYK